jgi:hypothetical protein
MIKKYLPYIVSFILSTLMIGGGYFYSQKPIEIGASTIFPYQGGTGISTVPTYGKLLVGNSGGTYTLTATSSLGITATMGSLDDLSDVVITGTDYGKLLMFNGSNWINQATSTLGITGLGTVTSIATDTTLTGGPITTTGTLGLNLANANTFSVLQTFTNASSTLFSASYASSTLGYFGTAYMPNLGTAAGTFLAVDATGQIIATSTPAGGGSGTVGTGTIGQFPYYAANGITLTATSSLFLATSGNLGIGTTSPYSLLSISNSVSTAANTPLFTIASTTAGTATSTLLTVLASGNVGIGIANPTSQLTQQSTLTFESAPLGAELTDDTGWTAPSDQWTGSYANGFNHVATTTASNLIRTVTISSGAYYQISFAISNNTAGSFTVALGSATSTQALSAGTATTTLTWAPKTASAIGNLAFIPTAAFVGRISAISVKQITGTYSPTYALLDTAGNAVIEMRSASSTLLNTFIGVNSGAYNVTGTSSTAVGNNALAFNTSGSSNSAIGTNALYNNITGSYNSAVGNNALYSNTTGYFNSAMGYQALYKNTTGYYNSAVGYRALYFNTTGYDNSAMGRQVLRANTTGAGNSAMGSAALYSNTTGNYNSAMGYYALFYNTTGYNNSAMGYYALGLNTTGYYNSAMGGYAFAYNRLGSGNSVFGYQAGLGVNNATNLTASSTIIGYQAGYSLGSTTANILIGYQAGYSLAGGTISSGSGSNNIVIGFNTDLPSTTQNSTLDIGNLIYATGLTNFSSPSSAVSAGNVGIGTSSPLTTLSIQGTAGANDVLNVASSTGASMLYVNAAGNVGIGTTTPAMKFSVQGDALADSWNVYSNIYQGDALTKLKDIKAEAGMIGDWVSVDHNSLPEGVLKNTPMTHYQNFYELYDQTIIDNATTTRYIKLSDKTLITQDKYDGLPAEQKGKTILDYTLQTMSISGLTMLNTKGLIQLDERLLKLEKPLGSIGSDGNFAFDKEALKKEIKDELRPEIKLMIDEAINQKLNSMNFWEKLKLLFE